MIQKRSLGRTGESASILGFGCMRLPLNGPKPDMIDVDLATRMLRTAIDQGVNYVDTAFSYHTPGSRSTPGASEPFVGQALSGGYREKVLLATKLPTWIVNSRAEMHKTLDQQLKRLGLPQIDFYLAHNLNMSVWGKLKELGLTQFFDEAVKDGRIRFPSFSFHDSYALFEEIVTSYDWAMAQVQYNYLDRDYQAGRTGVKLASDRGLAVVVMEPLRGGFLINHIPQEPTRWFKETRPNWSMAAWGLNWLWNQTEVSVVLSGMSTYEQVTENLELAQRFAEEKFSQSDLATIDRVCEYFASRLKTPCTGCSYCMPCPSGVEIPKNLGFYNQYYLFDAQETRDRCKFYYYAQTGTSERADQCTACHQCEEKCPQHIAIPDYMSKISETFTAA